VRVLLAPGGLWPEPAGVPLAGSDSGLAPGRVASCLASGWRAARPHDFLTLLPMADGGPGSAQVIGPDQVAAREAWAHSLPAHGEAIAIAPDHVERLGSDGPRGSQDDDRAHHSTDRRTLVARSR